MCNFTLNWYKSSIVTSKAKTSILKILQNYRRKAPALFLLEAGGRKYNFCPLPKGFRASKFIYEKKKKYV
jgi:hypothetical protein